MRLVRKVAVEDRRGHQLLLEVCYCGKVLCERVMDGILMAYLLDAKDYVMECSWSRMILLPLLDISTDPIIRFSFGMTLG